MHLRALAVAVAGLAGAAQGLSSLPQFTGRYMYCWKTAQSVFLTTIDSAKNLAYSEGLNCGFQMDFQVPDTLEINQVVPVNWTVSYNPANFTTNKLGMTLPLPLEASPADHMQYQVLHSNVHTCVYGDDICDAYVNGIYVRDKTQNQIKNFTSANSVTYTTQAELSFPRAGQFMVLAHLAMPANDSNQRYDFAVYRLVTVTEPATSSSGLTIGLAVGGSVLVLAIVGGICWRRRRRQGSAMKDYNFTETHGVDDTALLTQDPVTETALAQWRINEGEVERIKVLSQGAFGEVWLGTYRGTTVAIKKLLPGRNSPREVQDFVNEILLMTSFNSPYIVSCIGVSWYRRSDMMLLVEFMDQGDLRTMLDNTPTSAFTVNSKLTIASAIAQGLVYLHSLETPVIHRDMKSRNVLLDSEMHTKLTDFGVSREITSETMTIGIGTYRWMAPEILTDNHYSEAADIYSFGVILSELDTHQLPYSDQKNSKGNPITDTTILGLVMHGKIQPTFHHVLPEWAVDLAKKCMSYDADDRPTAFVLAHTLRQRLAEAN
ncbi:protein kinase [Achlya hypogyna]|uniref:Protein kinase n=1 Tax=Achlya hypogyna TaxID=1202772 RepID=A0A1V9YJH4_ACHHY|nr:protein kinase [Achlya hypogyna]